jgi:hypothetical protein
MESDTIEEEVGLRPFDPHTQVRPDNTILVVGQRNSGKSVLMTYLLYCLKDQLDAVVAFASTEDTRREWMKIMPRCFVHETYNEDILQRVVSAQKTIHSRAGDSLNPDAPTLRNLGIVLDDCMFDKSQFNGRWSRYIMMNGRHDKLFFMNGVQYVVDFPKALRSQIDLAIVFPIPDFKTREPVRENLLGVFKHDEQLVEAFEKLKPHEALVFDQRAYRMKQPYLFFLKAEFPLPSFRLCTRLMWWMYYRHLERQSYEHIDEYIDRHLAVATGSVGGAVMSKHGKTRIKRIEAGAGAMAGAGAGAGAGAMSPSIDVMDLPPPAPLPTQSIRRKLRAFSGKEPVTPGAPLPTFVD